MSYLFARLSVGTLTVAAVLIFNVLMFGATTHGANNAIDAASSPGIFDIFDLLAAEPQATPEAPSMAGRILSNFGNSEGFAVGAYNTDGTNPVNLTALQYGAYFRHPSQSRQTGTIAFAGCGLFAPVSRCRDYRIFVMNGDGSNIRQITFADGLTSPNDQTDSLPVISPDGTKVAFISGRSDYPLDANGQRLGEEVYVVNVDGTNLHQVSAKQIIDQPAAYSGDRSSASAVAWSPDSSQIVALCGRKYREAGIDQNNQEFLADRDSIVGMLRVFAVDGENDGTLVALALLPYPAQDPYHAANYSRQADKDKAFLDYDSYGYPRINGFNGAMIDWSPAGDTIIASINIITSNGFPTDVASVYYGVFNASGGLRSKLTVQQLIGGDGSNTSDGDRSRGLCQTAGCARISPDGQQLVYGSNNPNNPNYEIKIANLDGSSAHLIGDSTKLGGWNEAKWWSAGASVATPARLVLTPNPALIHTGGGNQAEQSVQITPTLYDAQGNVIVRAASFAPFFNAYPGTGFVCDPQHPCIGDHLSNDLNVDATGKVSVKPDVSVGSGAGSLCASNGNVIGCTVIGVNFPSVGINASVPITLKSGDGGAGRFTVGARENSSTGIPVNFTVGGTAVRDIDYTLSVTGNSFTLAASQSSFDITVTPNRNSSNKGDKTVILTLSPDSSNTYLLDGANSAATVTIKDDNPTPTAKLTLSSITPDKGGDGGGITANIYGANIQPGASVKLTRAGQTDIAGTNTSVAANVRMTATFDLTGKTQGAWDVVVTNPDGAAATLFAAFTIEANEPADVWVDVVGRYTFRSGTVQRFYIVYGNRGNTDAPAAVLRLYVPQGLSVVEPVTLSDGSQPVVYTNADGKTTSVQFFVPGVPAGATAFVPVNLKASVAHQDLKLRLTELNSTAIQSDVAVAVDSSFSLVTNVVENTDTSFKATIHVNSSNGSGDITVKTTFSDASAEEPSSIDVAETSDAVQYTFTGSVARSSTGTPPSPSQSPFVKTVVKMSLSKTLDGILTQITGTQTANALRKYQFETSLFNLLGQERKLTADEVKAKLTLVRGELAAAVLKQALQILSANSGASSNSAHKVYKYQPSGGGSATQGAINAINAAASAVQSATEKPPANQPPPSPTDNLLSNEKAKHDALLNICNNLKSPQKLGIISRQSSSSCDVPPAPLSEESSLVNVVFSSDPNEKDGSQGAGGAAQFLSGFEPFRYVVSFENKPDATAPAQTVVVADRLDAAKLDFSTFSLGAIGFGNTIVAVPPGLAEYSTDVDLRPANDLIARINAKLDKNTGILTWKFTSIDPTTNQPTTDALAGFLPPNKTSPEGQGNVTFSVMPKSELATGAEIRNTASIVFDANQAIATNEWLHTIDDSAPVSRVNALGATQSSVIFNVDWSGTDAGAGIEFYTIYVSENGGAFRVWRDDAAATSGSFTGERGKTYSFYSVARDKTGNVEASKSAAEATTVVSSTAAPNPFEGDVAARPDGDGMVLPDDLELMRQFVAGNLTASIVTNEFQRADSAPRSSSGDGILTATDLQQTRRYADRFDALQPTGGPQRQQSSPLTRVSSKQFAASGKLSPNQPDANTVIRPVSTTASKGSSIFVSIEMDSQGTETAASFTLNFDSSRLTNPRAALGRGAPTGTILTANSKNAANGQIGILVDSANTFASGTRQIATVQFDVPQNALAGQSNLTFGNLTTPESTSNTNADLVTTDYAPGTFTVLAPTAANVTVSGRAMTAQGRGIRNVMLRMTDGNGAVRVAYTTTFGYYRFTNVVAGETYVFTVKGKRFEFTHPTQVLNVSEDTTDVNFIAVPQ